MSEVRSREITDFESQLSLPESTILLTHEIFKIFDKAKKSTDILLSDLYSSSKSISLSAFSVLGTLKDSKAIPYIAKFLDNDDKDKIKAAVDALGQIGGGSSIDTLIRLFKLSRDESLRLEILRSLAINTCTNQEIRTLIKVYAESPIIDDEIKAAAIDLYLSTDEKSNISDFLSRAEPGSAVLNVLYRRGAVDRRYAQNVVDHAVTCLPRLSVEEKKLLLKCASPFKSPKSFKILTELMMDIYPEVRKACYEIIGEDPEQRSILEKLIEFLSDGVESNPEFEEDVKRALFRIEEIVLNGGRFSYTRPDEIIEKIRDLFNKIKAVENRISSDSHELGWLITHAKEYLEFYGDEDLKQAIVNYLKGSGNYTEDELLKQVRESAVRVEVKHFDGYNAIVEIIKNPNRAGSALIARELSIAKLGKRKIMYRLIRNLYIARLINMSNVSELFYNIYSWSRKVKLFRLAEAALFALSNVDENRAVECAKENIAPPTTSKILTIASLRLLRHLDWRKFEQELLNLYRETSDKYILLNLIEATSSYIDPVPKSILGAVVRKFSEETDREILSRIFCLIKGNISEDLLGVLIKETYENSDENKRKLILEIVKEGILEGTLRGREDIIEFLYRIIRNENKSIKGYAAGLLYATGDDYALEVIRDIISKGDTDSHVALVESLTSFLDEGVVEVLKPLFYSDDLKVYDALRRMLEKISQCDVGEKLLELALKIRKNEEENDDITDFIALKKDDQEINLLKEKKTYQFEREYVEKLYILFTDIEGYTRKSQQLSSIELSKLIQDYEGILIPVLSNHGGTLIKRIGDGHLFAFKKALNSVLGAIRLQKALKRFNNFQEEKFRIAVRVGIHGGEVIRRDGDVYGSTVNLASRLESSAKGGKIYISQDVYNEVSEWIHANPVGEMSFKGIAKPVQVYEPYEVSLNLPANLDPIKSGKTEIEVKDHSLDTATYESDKPFLDKKFLAFIRDTFATLHGICTKVEKGDVEIAKLKAEILRRWKMMKKYISGGK